MLAEPVELGEGVQPLVQAVQPGRSLFEIAFMSPELYRLLVCDRGWPPERYEQWLKDLLIDQLLPPSAAGPEPPASPRLITLRAATLSAVIEITRFRLAPGTDEAAFLAADRKVQEDFAYQQPGMLRRTTARGNDGGWIVIDLWRSVADADACDARWEHDP